METVSTALSAEQALVGGAALGTLLGGMLGTIVTVGTIVTILLIIANWKIFTKAGEKGWKSLIPLYNSYITFKIFWKSQMFWVVIAGTFFCSLLAALVGTETAFGVMFTFIGAVFSAVVTLLLYYRMSKSFGHGIPFTLGLIFLPNIFTLILAFGKDKYKKIA